MGLTKYLFSLGNTVNNLKYIISSYKREKKAKSIYVSYVLL